MKLVIIVLIILIIFQIGVIFFLLKTRKEMNEKYQSNLNNLRIEQKQYVKELENVQQTMNSIISSVNTIHLYAELIKENTSSEETKSNLKIIIAESESVLTKA